MKGVISGDVQDLMNVASYRPAISIILPFEPKMSLKSEVAQSLRSVSERIEKMLAGAYPEDSSALVMEKLHRIIRGLNMNTHKKSLAIFVSPVFEKVMYLDVPVEERITVGESFDIRDLVYAKKQAHKYLVLLISYNRCQMYLGEGSNLVRIISNKTTSIHPYVNDVPERVANFSDMSERKEVMMDKFIHKIDNNLSMVLNAYPLPVFVMATRRIGGHFKKLTRHTGSILRYVHGNYDDTPADQLKEVLAPYIRNWREVVHRDILNRLEDAYGKGMLATGIRNVWHEAMNHKGRLLVVEKDFIYPALRKDRSDIVPADPECNNRFSYVHDAVDQVIEAVLENGGDVEFVEKDLLSHYGHVALLQYY
jgi:hypothetical protein